MTQLRGETALGSSGTAAPGIGRPGPLSRLGPAGAAVAASGVAVNALAYVVPLIGARQLSPDGLGALATVLAIGAIATVPGLGLQAAVAVEWARHGGVSNSGRATLVTAAVATAAIVAAAPILTVTLRLPPELGLLVAATTAAVVLASRWLGQMQGNERFGRLALGMILLAVARYGGVLIGLAFGAGVTWSLALGAMVAWLLLPALVVLARWRGPTAAPSPGRLTGRAIVGASSATLAMLATSYADLILARNLLPPAETGSYAVGAVLTKGALWAPQVVTILALPRLAKGSRRALLAALGAVGGCGVGLVLAAALAGDLAMRLAGGPAYVGLAPYAAGFATVGAFYALAFVLVNGEIAAKVRWPGAPLWIALAGLVIATRLLGSPTLGSVLTASIVTAGLAVVVMSISTWLRSR